MGEIIAWRRSQPERQPTPASGSAAILFFTGVRYYRMTDEDIAKASAPKRPRASKRKPAVGSRLQRHG